MTDAEFDQLRADARAMMDKGELPATIPQLVIGDDCTEGNARCCLCEVDLNQFEGFRYILSAPSGKLPDGTDKFVLCFHCHTAWAREVITGAA